MSNIIIKNKIKSLVSGPLTSLFQAHFTVFESLPNPSSEAQNSKILG